VTKLPKDRSVPRKASGSSVASAILPQIERLRGNRLSSAPVPARHTPAHKWLIASARRVVSRFRYFQKRENPDTAAFDEKPHRNA
jgi:hypothetical protein